MEFSFCIITDGSLIAKERIKLTISSIESLNIPIYEILCIGGDDNFDDISSKNFKKFNFDETQRPGWITKKKNDIALIAKYSNLVVFHDYYIFEPGWLSGYLNMRERFFDADICLNPILLFDGTRDFTDWVTWDHPIYGGHKMVNYNNQSMTKYQYISGGYFVIKREFFLAHPFDENLLAMQSEDVEWSLRIRNIAKIIFNKESIVKHTKLHRNIGVVVGVAED